MPEISKPTIRPHCPHFSSGPCAKRPGWSLSALQDAVLGRSHRGALGKARLKQVIDETHRLLGLPADYVLGIVPASDTGAVEMALWSLLGPLPVDIFAWETFGREWVTDCVVQLKPLAVHRHVAEFGLLPDLSQADPGHDLVFPWNGTTSGVMVPNGDWISDRRTGLAICDATSAVMAMPLPWPKLDVVTFSWQKVLGGEAAHGMIVLSPRALARLESHRPAWPVPKIFRLTDREGKVMHGIFEGETINTPSMLCVEDAIDALAWARRVGGSAGLVERTQANFAVLSNWVARTPWIEFLARDPAIRSPTSVCLRLSSGAMPGEDLAAQAKRCQDMTLLLEREGVAFDIKSYRDAPPGFRVWCGATIEPADVQALTLWLDWSFAATR